MRRDRGKPYLEVEHLVQKAIERGQANGTTDRRCKFHLCAATFHATHGNQRFCSRACSTRFNTWAMNRGRRIVNAMIDTGQDAMNRAASEIENEYQSGFEQ